MNFFDFLNSINFTKIDLIQEDPTNEKEYNSFMINRGLSYFADTIMYANEMNMSYGIDKKMQYRFYLEAIPKKKRFSKWAKKESADKNCELIMKAYGCSKKNAIEALSILTEQQIAVIKSFFDQGGR